MAKKELGKSGKNITYDLNHQIIRDSYVKLIKNLKRKPTIAEVSKDCNLSHNTIDKHIKELKFNPLKHPLRILSDDVILSIVNSAKKGSSASQKLWMQICEGWTEKQVIEHEGEIITGIEYITPNEDKN
ncbi:MAG: hypothetical protein HQ541_16190 [Mariniphaga sp.]|nr:hypothetical protein [Mariniphaga sp.]